MPSNNEKKTARTSTPFAHYLGALAAALTEQALFHPLDTLAKNAMRGKALFSQFKMQLWNVSLLQAIQRLYKGFNVAIWKKAPMRSYKWPMQTYLCANLEEKYSAELTKWFGNHAELAQTTIAASITGATEPLLFHALDTVQVRQQNLQEPITRENIRRLGISGLYRGAMLTAALRNIPGCIGLFTGSELANQSLNNKNKENDYKNFAAKWFGSFLSILISQPGDVLKTRLQTEQISALEALKKISPRELFMGGLAQRLCLSGKVGFGFLLAEKLMKASAGAFGRGVEKVSEPTETPSANRHRLSKPM